MEKTNANRFITAYNTIDYALRAQYGFSQGMSFSTVVRKSVTLDSVIRKYEDTLIDYGRLRNAIIHRSNDDYVIAEPHIDVVEDFERMATLIITPPKVLETFCKGSVTSVESSLSIKDVVQIISQTGYSNIPVYKDGCIAGVANGQRLINKIGDAIANGIDPTEYMNNTQIENVIFPDKKSPYYVVADKNLTIEQAMHLFFTNRKLLVILITKTGDFKELPIGILTVADVMDINKMLDNY